MTKTKPFDAAKYLNSPELIAAYLSEAFESADAALISKALGNVARAKGMADIAKKSGLSRENLYRSLGTEARPEFATIMKVIDAMGLQLSAKAKDAA